MRITKSLVVGVLFGLPIFAACRGSSNTAKPDGAEATGDSGGGQIHIQDVQSDAMAPGTAVELHGVIVTAIDTFGTRNGDLWVEEPGGGQYSGVHVFGTPLTQVGALHIGDIVDITGAIKSEFKIDSDTSGRTVTEVQAPKGGTITVSKTGTGTVPAPMVVDALAIGTKATQAERDAEWEKWEGVLITVKNVSATGAPACIKSKGVCTDVDSFGITGVAKLESALAAFPAPAIDGGDCLASVTGVVDYVFDYLIYPRTTDEVVTSGTTCPHEDAAGATNLCTDNLDNDGDGFKDCSDFDCEVGPHAWLGAHCLPADATCGCSANLPTGGVNKVDTTATGAVMLHDVVVTAVGATGFWIADAAQAAKSAGVLVLTLTAPDASIVVGAQLPTLQGIAGATGPDGKQKLFRITRATPGTATAGTAPVPLASTVAEATDLVTGAPLAGSLVQLGPLKVTTAIDATTHRIKLTDNSGKVITMADSAFKGYTGTDIKLNDCFTTVTGVMDLLTDDQVRTINPRSAADLPPAADGVCN